jgi:hypothetical protein
MYPNAEGLTSYYEYRGWWALNRDVMFCDWTAKRGGAKSEVRLD